MAKLPIQRLKVEHLERKLFMERETHPEPFFSQREEIGTSKKIK